MAKQKGKGVDQGAFKKCFSGGDTRYNPWGKGSTKNPTNSSQTTGP